MYCALIFNISGVPSSQKKKKKKNVSSELTVTAVGTEQTTQFEHKQNCTNMMTVSDVMNHKVKKWLFS